MLDHLLLQPLQSVRNRCVGTIKCVEIGVYTFCPSDIHTCMYTCACVALYLQYRKRTVRTFLFGDYNFLCWTFRSFRYKCVYQRFIFIHLYLHNIKGNTAASGVISSPTNLKSTFCAWPDGTLFSGHNHKWPPEVSEWWRGPQESQVFNNTSAYPSSPVYLWNK